ncbi:hypothetical protein [Streptomyces sp. PD-S100-1]|uniref:hypothetical protein n=1 Tax=Streptomyces sp. PD-S100-1 TaxID=3394351 RepID=UPI0039BC7C42
MTKLLLSLHVLAAIVAVGPVTVAASMFPATSRRVVGAPPGEALPVLRTLHRVCRVYAGVGIAVPLFGLATAGSLGVLGDTWVIVSIVLTAAAAGVLALLVLPAQEHVLAAVEKSAPVLPPQRLAMLTGLFNLLWATVTVVMIVRPGSTTGV